MADLTRMVDYDYNIVKMIDFANIDMICDYLVENTINISIIDFIKLIQEKIYSDVEIKFLDYFLKICQADLTVNKFCINPNEEFVKLGVKSKEIESKDLLITIQNSQLIENEDYCLLGSAPEQTNGRGGHNKKIYMVSPDGFKMLLLDIHDHKQRIKFIKYYLLLERCISYYDKYQKIISSNNIIYLKKINENLKNDLINCRNVINERKDHHAINPKSKTKLDYVMCMQSNLEPNVIRIIRGHKSNINTQKAKHCKNWNILIPMSIVPNSCKIVNIFKENNNKLYMLAKNRLNAERRAGKLETAIYQIKINYIFENKLITIDGSILKLNTDQDIVSMEDVKKILKDTIEERYDLKTP